jgi:putative ABC transport system permease protein
MNARPPRPPRIARWLLRRSLPPDQSSRSIEADLNEEFHTEAARSSPRRAARKYWREVWSLSSRYAATRQKASLMDMLWHDIRHAIRSLAAARGFTITTVLTLALSIGAATAIYAVTDAVVLRPLPFKDSSRLMWGLESFGGGGQMTLSWPNALDWQARQTVFSEFVVSRSMTSTLTGAGAAARLQGRSVMWNFLHVLGVEPAFGRGFTEDDVKKDSQNLVLISDSLWRSRFGGAETILGQSIVLGGVPLTVIGVLPPGFQYISPIDFLRLMTPAAASPSDKDRGNHTGFTALGRLKPGVTEDAAKKDLARIAKELEREYPASNTGNGAVMMSLTERAVGAITPTLTALLGAVGVLLLLACVNVANLLVARGAARGHELSVRAALGCGRLRLARQLFVESSLLAIAGGAAGILFGSQLLRVFVALAPEGTPRMNEIGFGTGVVGAALLASTAAAIIFGVLPAALASGARAQEALVRSSRLGQSASHRLRRGLMIVEVALALVLLVGAGLMGRTLMRLWSVDPGFNPNGLLTMRMSLQGPRWTQPAMQAFYDDLLLKANAVPGVKSAALSLAVPIAGGEWGSVFIVDDRPVPERKDIPSATWCPVSGNYFETLGLKLVRGRFLTDADGTAAQDFAVVNERFANKFWPNQNPIGKRVKQGWPEWTTPWREIVGVVSDVKENGVTTDPPIQVYLPIRKTTQRTFALIARAEGSTDTIAAPLQAIVRNLDADLPVYSVLTVNELMTSAVSRQRVTLAIIGAFAFIAVLVACVGLYGVVAHGVTERRREIGIRMALGATGGSVLRMFVGQGLVTALVGIVLGLAGAYATAKYLETLLFQVDARDTATFAGVSVLLVVVAIAACYLPARRAAAVEPTSALRGE